MSQCSQMYVLEVLSWFKLCISCFDWPNFPSSLLHSTAFFHNQLMPPQLNLLILISSVCIFKSYLWFHNVAVFVVTVFLASVFPWIHVWTLPLPVYPAALHASGLFSVLLWLISWLFLFSVCSCFSLLWNLCCLGRHFGPLNLTVMAGLNQ